MQSQFRASARLTLSTVLGLSLCAALCGAPARAQDSMSKNKMKQDRRMAQHDEAMPGDMDDYSEHGMPVSPQYPRAAPGSLDQTHWSDYRRVHMEAGSATEKMMDQRMAAKTRMDAMEDENELVPATPMYPKAAPGAIDMYHWTDYTRVHLRAGAAMEAREEKMRAMDRQKMASMMHDEDETDVLPVTPQYPWAAPGSIDTMHWASSRRMYIEPGSASEARMDKMNKKDKVMKDRMQKTP